MHLLVDQDGVLSGFDQAVHAYLSSCFPPEQVIPLEQRKSFYYHGDYPAEMQVIIDELLTSPGFHVGLPVIPGSIEALYEMRDAGHEVSICTSPLTTSPTCASEKFEWVATNVGSEWLNRLIITKDKTVVRGDILYDDKPEITGKMLPEWRHAVVSASYNMHIDTPYRVDSLVDWKNVIEKV
jgi:5'-nucleotidase